jgi:NADH-ubiquinone oxidoreductase chain 4
VLLPLLGIIFLSSINRTRINNIKIFSLFISILTLCVSLLIYIFFDNSNVDYQFIQEITEINGLNIYIGIDGISIYFILLTTFITPIVILSNWYSISDNIKTYMIIILLLEMLLIFVFLVLNIFLFYIFFESTLIPLFLLIGIYGSYNKVRASFYLFLYTLLGSLFLLLSILYIMSFIGMTDFDVLFKTNLNYATQLLLFYGIFIAFAVKTPVIFLNNWLLKAHVESPLGGSILLAAIVLKLSLYGVFRLILPIIPKASINYTYIVYMICVITIIYASISTLRTIDIKELIAYSSVSHAAVYLLGVFSNTIQGLEGSIILGLGHGFVSSGLFICVGGILYDRSHTRLISVYRGLAQIMPLFSILFFILCLSNAGTPLSINFIGEFLSLYGTFERLPVLGIFASSSIVLSAAYTMYMFNRIAFGGNYSKYFIVNIIDLTYREFIILITLVIITVALGIYPIPIMDGLNYCVTGVLYNTL